MQGHSDRPPTILRSPQPRARRRLWLGLLLPVLVPLWTARLAAQEPDTALPSGVRLGLIYQTSFRPKVAVRFFGAGPRLAGVAGEVHGIVRQDLEYSDRFEMTRVPGSLAGGPVNYAAWNGLGVVFLVTGNLQPARDGYLLRLTLHDVVYATVKQVRAFPLPARDAPNFRLAVHAASDAMVRWATGEPGMAASRITFVQRGGDGGYEIFVVDYDGANLRRIAGSDQILLSPVWSPDGRAIAYSKGPYGAAQLIRHELGSDASQVIGSDLASALTPSYSPDGSHLAFGMAVAQGGGARTEIHAYDVANQCCLRRVSRGPLDDMSPTYSPDGERIAFMSNRLGQPHIYVMPATGGEPTLLSPFVYGEPGYYTSPDWSPVGSLVAFHGRSRGNHQIMVADASNPGETVRQITTDGVSEDPSWAPDGRHVVFTGVRAGEAGLFVIDTVTGRLRPLHLGGGYLVPDWSPSLLPTSALPAGQP